MKQPQGYVSDLVPANYVCKLKKALYGLKQAPKAWYSRLTQKLQSLGFQSSLADSSLLIFRSKDLIMYILVYVDDIIIISSVPSATYKLIQSLGMDFAVKDLGSLHFFLGIKVEHNDQGVILSQERYATDLLKRANMENCKPISTPMSTSEKLSKDSSKPLDEKGQFLYRSIVGGLQYLTITRPDLSFAVNKACQFVQNPTDQHLGGQ
mgnify:CR=1 FL=1